ncbi:MAG: translation elongation factor Ts [Bacilli bacterium]|mgnify:CR=1 FL=1|nr:translation elongation factor Ts [Bacilli bacterium]
MADSLIDLIKVLRERTGAGLMDCKGALLANDCDLDKAGDWLREKGLAKAAKKADRIAAEGLALAVKCNKCTCGTTVVIEVNCETDFVAKGEAFHDLVESVARVILEKRPATVEEAKALTEGLFTDATVKMGEKFDLRRFEILEKGNGIIGSYIHMGGKIAVGLVAEGADEELAKQLAMHIAANNPQYLKLEDVPAEIREHEMQIQKEAAKTDEKLANKPAPVLEKILEGKINKYFSEMALESQPFLLDDSKTVGQVLLEKKVKINKFVRYQVGEGIEKRKDDFASEVMAQSK